MFSNGKRADSSNSDALIASDKTDNKVLSDRGKYPERLNLLRVIVKTFTIISRDTLLFRRFSYLRAIL